MTEIIECNMQVNSYYDEIGNKVNKVTKYDISNILETTNNIEEYMTKNIKGKNALCWKIDKAVNAKAYYQKKYHIQSFKEYIAYLKNMLYTKSNPKESK